MTASVRSIIYFITVYLYINVYTGEFVDVTIGGENIFFQTQEHLVDSSNGVHNYVCEEDDTIDLICKSKCEKGQMRLRFYDKYGTIVIDTATQDLRYEDRSLNFRLQISDKQFDRSYVDCTYFSPNDNGQQNFTYRTVVTVIPKNSNGFIVTINDKKLTTKIFGMDGADIYTYKYSPYEHLINITCAKKKQFLPGAIYGSIINRSNEDIVFEDIINQTSRYTALIETRNIDGMIFQCQSEFESNNLVANIHLLLETNRDPIVLGLTARNILYEYNIGNTEWLIHYQYRVDEVLNLTCVTGHDRLLEWVYPDYLTTKILEDSSEKTNYINNIIPINTEPNNNITCESKKLDLKRKVVIVLHEMSDLLAQKKYLNDTNGIADNLLHDEEKQFTALEIIGVFAGISIAVVAVFIVFYCRGWKKKIHTKEEGRCRSADTVSKHANQEQNNEYTYIENVNNGNQSQDRLNSLVSNNSQDYGYQEENMIYTA